MSADRAARPCVNGDGRPVHPPSRVLCKPCFEELDEKMRNLADLLGVPKRQGVRNDGD